MLSLAVLVKQLDTLTIFSITPAFLQSVLMILVINAIQVSIFAHPAAMVMCYQADSANPAHQDVYNAILMCASLALMDITIKDLAVFNVQISAFSVVLLLIVILVRTDIITPRIN